MKISVVVLMAVAVTAAGAAMPPRDAVVLFDGTQKSFDENWMDVKGRKAKWKCVDGTIESTRSAGDIRTRREFGDVQLHVEWQIPANLPPYDMNGVLVQDGWPLEGPTGHIRRTRQTKPPSGKGPVKLQQHLCPVRFRNVWIRELPDGARKENGK